VHSFAAFVSFEFQMVISPALWVCIMGCCTKKVGNHCFHALFVIEIGWSRYEDGLLSLRVGITTECSHDFGTTPVAHILLNKNKQYLRREYSDQCLNIPYNISWFHREHFIVRNT